MKRSTTCCSRCVKLRNITDGFFFQGSPSETSISVVFLPETIANAPSSHDVCGLAPQKNDPHHVKIPCCFRITSTSIHSRARTCPSLSGSVIRIEFYKLRADIAMCTRKTTHHGPRAHLRLFSGNSRCSNKCLKINLKTKSIRNLFYPVSHSDDLRDTISLLVGLKENHLPGQKSHGAYERSRKSAKWNQPSHHTGIGVHDEFHAIGFLTSALRVCYPPCFARPHARPR